MKTRHEKQFQKRLSQYINKLQTLKLQIKEYEERGKLTIMMSQLKL